jgi:hypothetical protein
MGDINPGNSIQVKAAFDVPPGTQPAALEVHDSIFGAPAAMAESSKYGSCKEAAQDGRYNIPKDDPDYDPKLDRDGDGIACER